jgi:hypothetical protein
MESKHMRWIFPLICVIAAVAFALLYRDITQTADDTTQNAIDIQQSRRDYILWECNDINERNIATKKRLENYPFAAETREFIYAFIDESLPVRICDDLVREFAPIPPGADN